MITSTTTAFNMDNKAIDYLLLLLPLMGNRRRGTVGGRYNGCVLPLLVQLFFSCSMKNPMVPELRLLIYLSRSSSSFPLPLTAPVIDEDETDASGGVDPSISSLSFILSSVVVVDCCSCRDGSCACCKSHRVLFFLPTLAIDSKFRTDWGTIMSSNFLRTYLNHDVGYLVGAI